MRKIRGAFRNDFQAQYSIIVTWEGLKSGENDATNTFQVEIFLQKKPRVFHFRPYLYPMEETLMHFCFIKKSVGQMPMEGLHRPDFISMMDGIKRWSMRRLMKFGN